MDNIEYTIVEDYKEQNIKWAKFNFGEASIQIRAVQNEQFDIEESATQKKVNDWIECNLPADETV